MDIALKWLHVTGNIFWIGAICAVALVLTSGTGDAKTRGELGVGIYMKLAMPAFLVSFALGAVRLFMDVSYFLKEHHWMHGKLVVALAAIAIHHVIGGRAKKMARGDAEDAGPTGKLMVALMLCVVVATFFAVVRVPD